MCEVKSNLKGYFTWLNTTFDGLLTVHKQNYIIREIKVPINVLIDGVTVKEINSTPYTGWLHTQGSHKRIVIIMSIKRFCLSLDAPSAASTSAQSKTISWLGCDILLHTVFSWKVTTIFLLQIYHYFYCKDLTIQKPKAAAYMWSFDPSFTKSTNKGVNYRSKHVTQV